MVHQEKDLDIATVVRINEEAQSDKKMAEIVEVFCEIGISSFEAVWKPKSNRKIKHKNHKNKN